MFRKNPEEILFNWETEFGGHFFRSSRLYLFPDHTEGTACFSRVHRQNHVGEMMSHQWEQHRRNLGHCRNKFDLV